MKKIFSLLLSLTFTLSAFSLFSITTGCGGEKEFKTKLRFAVTSDLRLQDNGANQSLERLNAFFNTAYAYSNSDQNYKNLDALFFVGDNTNVGSKTNSLFSLRLLTKKLTLAPILKQLWENVNSVRI